MKEFEIVSLETLVSIFSKNEAVFFQPGLGAPQAMREIIAKSQKHFFCGVWSFYVVFLNIAPFSLLSPNM